MATDTANKPAETKPAAANKPAKKKERKFHPVRYLKETWGELKKLTWLSRKDLVSHTLAVIVFVLGMAAIIYILDTIFAAGYKLIG